MSGKRDANDDTRDAHDAAPLTTLPPRTKVGPPLPPPPTAGLGDSLALGTPLLPFTPFSFSTIQLASNSLSERTWARGGCSSGGHAGSVGCGGGGSDMGSGCTVSGAIGSGCTVSGAIGSGCTVSGAIGSGCTVSGAIGSGGGAIAPGESCGGHPPAVTNGSAAAAGHGSVGVATRAAAGGGSGGGSGCVGTTATVEAAVAIVSVGRSHVVARVLTWYQ